MNYIILFSLVIIEINIPLLFLEGVDYWDMVASGIGALFVLIFSAIRKEKPR